MRSYVKLVAGVVVAAVIAGCSVPSGIEEYHGYAGANRGMNMVYGGIIRQGPYFTFNQTDENGIPIRGYFVIDSDGSCDIEKVLHAAEQSFQNHQEISFKAKEVDPKILELESCPELEERVDTAMLR